jgi:glycerophosphoryl diester phosphodiesterase
MKIISHRGYWKDIYDKNSLDAFRRSFEKGFGIETDLRDFDQGLVISHDMPSKNSTGLDSMMQIYAELECNLTLALNIKSDGLQEILFKKLSFYNIKNYFVFDMSVPDALNYLKLGFKVYTRHSEYEQYPAFYEKAKGVWIDEFNGHWINEEIIHRHIKAGKEICIVSPELHGRDYDEAWQEYKNIENTYNLNMLSICTDYPLKAQKFFNG